MCANSLPLVSFSPCRRDLHAKVRIEILIGHVALCKSMYIYLPGEGKLREERDEGREEGGQRERERETSRMEGHGAK